MLNVRLRGVMGGDSLYEGIPEAVLECWLILFVSFSPSDAPSSRANFADFRGVTVLSVLEGGARDMEGGAVEEGKGQGRDGRGERRRAFKLQNEQERSLVIRAGGDNISDGEVSRAVEQIGCGTWTRASPVWWERISTPD